MTLTVGVSEATDRDGDTDTLAVGLKTANVEPALHLARKLVVEAKEDKNGVRIQEIEDSTLEPQEKEKNELADEIEAVGIILLCIVGVLNGIEVTFLIDSGASECFLSNPFVEKNKIKTSKTKEKLKI